MLKIGPSEAALVVSLVLNVLNIIDRSSSLKQKANEPMNKMEHRLTQLEDKVEKLSTYTTNDNARIENLEEGGRVLLKSLGALLSHGIDGNNIQEMKLAREELNEYLIRR